VVVNATNPAKNRIRAKRNDALRMTELISFMHGAP